MIAPSQPTPSLSVVVVVLDGGDNLARCLDALQHQENSLALEIVVAHDDRLGDAAAWQEQFPSARFTASAQHRRNYPALRAAGILAARGEIIAATEDQCIPPPRWCASIIAEHATGTAAAMGGPVEKRRPDSLLNWAIYLREFGEYTPPVREGPSTALTDCNVTYKRGALEAVADSWREEFHEPLVHGALAARGQTLWLSPSLLTFQQRSFTFGFAVRERYRFGRLFGRLRLASLGNAKRTLLILVSPLLPLLLTARVVLRAFHKRKYIGVTLLAVPYLLLFSAAWAAGETVSYLAGHRSPATGHRR